MAGLVLGLCLQSMMLSVRIAVFDDAFSVELLSLLDLRLLSGRSRCIAEFAVKEREALYEKLCEKFPVHLGKTLSSQER